MIFLYKNLKKHRQKKNISCQKLSQMIGVGRTTFWKWETGSGTPSEAQIRQLAKFLNVSITELSDLEPEQPTSEINYSETINSWLSFLDMNYELKQQKSINDALQKILSLNKELLKASVMIRALLLSTSSIIYMKDKNLKYITANDAFLKNVALPSHFKVLNKKDSDFFPTSEAKFNHDEDRCVLLSGKPILDEECYIPGSRKKKWGYVAKQPILDTNNKISGVIASFTDITKLKEKEKLLKLLEHALANSRDCISVRRVEPYKFMYLSESCKDIFGHTREEFFNDISIRLKQCVHPDDVVKEAIYFKSKTPPPLRKYRLITPDSKIKYIQESSFSVSYNNIDYICGITRDITESVNAESNIIKREFEIAKSLKTQNVAPEIISIATGLALEKIKDLYNEKS